MTNNQGSPNPAQGAKQPNDKRPPAGGDQDRDFEDPVNEASDESFPASDPPSWTSTTATKDGE